MNNDEHQTLLIVDDTPTNVQVLLGYLENRGYKVLIATDGAQALQRASLGNPDLILMDILMPGMDGLETCERLKADPQLQNIPVIFMTALGETQDKIRGFAAGGVDYVTKPLAQEEVLARIRTHLTLRKLQVALNEQNGRLQATSAQLQAMTDGLTDYLRGNPIGDACAGLINNAIQQTAASCGLIGLFDSDPATGGRVLAAASSKPNDTISELIESIDTTGQQHFSAQQFGPTLMALANANACIAVHDGPAPSLLKVADQPMLAAPLVLQSVGDEPPAYGFFALFGPTHCDDTFQSALSHLAQAANTIIECDRSRQRELIESGKRKKAEAETRYLRDEIRGQLKMGKIVGQSAALRRVIAQVEQVANTDSTVIIHGETGTGKELIARALHDLSSRADHPLITVNCAALPETLVESELFGHEKGAFTGATGMRRGRFELADGGTLFLDEIGDMPLEAQTKLLRVLQEQQFERIGGSKPLHVDVRVLTASHRYLPDLIEAGTFREDLYYRLNVFPIDLPPLRERVDDILPLAEHFASRSALKFQRPFSNFSATAKQQLCAYHWPGNVRELENIIERSVILATSETIDVALNTKFTVPTPRSDPQANPDEIWADRPSLAEIQRRYIAKILAECDWTVEGTQGAAAILDIHPSTLRGRMVKLGISKPND